MSTIKRIFQLAAVFIFLIFGCKSTGTISGDVALVEIPAIIPAPTEANWGSGQFIIPENNTICYNSGAKISAEWLQHLLQAAKINSEVTSGDTCGNWNIILDSSLQDLGEEGYALSITNTGVSLKSATETGLFYGIQTLRQFMPAGVENASAEKVPALRNVEIKDSPKYSWRGSMVDMARSFFGIDYLKRHVDRMALYKLNRLHLHLTDDQGWRIEIKSKPKLTEIGGKSAVKDGNSGFITQEEYIELQDYALARNIVIIPEVDMPGHVYAALVSYPELNCAENSNINPKKATPPDLYSGYEVGWSRFCLEDEKTYDFVSEIVGELAKITKGPWIHLGGDEIEDPRYEEFVVKADSIVRHYGKTSIGWEEVTKAEVDGSLISQNWNGKTKSIVDVKIIESICSNFYLDHANFPGQENTLNWCKPDGVSIKNVYDFKTNNPNVIGVEAPVWTEHVTNDAMMDDRFWPRLAAVAEIGWSQDSNRNFEDFITRLKKHENRLRNMGIRFHPSPEIDWVTKSKVMVDPGNVYAGFEVKN
ncbi:beta-N-acetylhexosaminidase [Gramella sp. AN32]|uniref:beta-N-acetylhexosaminidase n=1 Tax=Christiangramia antarctica TaxID=2058158 RepID=A0ABW5X6B4_9FLAO|nr:beta-N-acetylhexosaminidase [Gramella sp. AN32]MCM4156294.1 beta-N-acetylhexosaminidase [Gramella sp. AN32]